MRLWIIILGALLAPMTFAGGGMAIGQTVASPREATAPIAQLVRLQRLTGASPFGGVCVTDGVQPNLNAEGESHLAVDPTNPDHLVAAWQQDRMQKGGGAQSDVTAVTYNGGETWTSPVTVAGISKCTGGRYQRVTDPKVAIATDGRALLASLSFDIDPPQDLFNWPGAEQVSASSDGGKTWGSGPVEVEADKELLEWPDIEADPVLPNHAYLAWERDIMDPVSGLFSDGHIRFARTDDGGATWSDPVTVPPDHPGIVEAPYGGLHAVPRRGGGTDLVLIYASMPFTTRNVAGPIEILSVSSADLGATWSAPTKIRSSGGGHVADIETGTFVAGGFHGTPSIGALGRDGALYITWTEVSAMAPGGTDLLLARSVDLGKTWTTGTVARIPAQVFLPSIAVSGDGTVGVTWYDFRNDRPGDSNSELTTNLWFSHSSDRGHTWREMHVGGPFDLRAAPKDQGVVAKEVTPTCTSQRSSFARTALARDEPFSAAAQDFRAGRTVAPSSHTPRNTSR